MNIQQQSEQYVKGITSRRRDPVKKSTLNAYSSYLRTWILPWIGKIELSDFDNRAMKEFVNVLTNHRLSASTIAGVTNCVKDIIKSCQDDNGNVLYPKVWNSDFIDAPLLDPTLQKAPIIARQALQDSICRVSDEYRGLYTLLAGTGLRISEALALKCGPDDGVSSVYLPDSSKVIVRKQFKMSALMSPKTKAGLREVDIAPELNAILAQETPLMGGFLYRNENGGPARVQTLYDLNDKIGIPGFHSLRRFRVTHLRSQNVPEDILKYWIGHSTNKDITDRYSKLGQYVELRKQWSEKAGLGFEIK
jgi:integrase